MHRRMQPEACNRLIDLRKPSLMCPPAKREMVFIAKVLPDSQRIAVLPTETGNHNVALFFRIDGTGVGATPLQSLDFCTTDGKCKSIFHATFR